MEGRSVVKTGMGGSIHNIESYDFLRDGKQNLIGAWTEENVKKKYHHTMFVVETGVILARTYTGSSFYCFGSMGCCTSTKGKNDSLEYIHCNAITDFDVAYSSVTKSGCMCCDGEPAKTCTVTITKLTTNLLGYKRAKTITMYMQEADMANILGALQEVLDKGTKTA